MTDELEDAPSIVHFPDEEDDISQEMGDISSVIGILRHNADVNCAFLARCCKEPFLFEVYVYAKRGTAVWEYDAIRKEYPKAMISTDFTTLCTETTDIFSSLDEFEIFNIDKDEHRIIFDHERFEGPLEHNHYFREVFMPWRAKAYNEPESEAKRMFEASMHPNARIDDQVLETIRQYDVIVQLAEGFDPTLFVKQINATDEVLGELADYVKQPKRL